ncbi:hypothetical protein [Candidatus Halobonum tyrrellensis]|uniref:Uncharacterized protein n=1 Tax=Candidatus Halobonum tyrrellensis G22 TaxID=1324957 RepID=V4HKR7_9EURY|nr:hypothetical protein [Candidatus Halobonum tyrrellensis]ESP88519.1 hypothetical protein K933_08667 [Candidatus Halobonum tyrrellensis G22]
MATEPDSEADRWRPMAVAVVTGLVGVVQAYRYASVPDAGVYAAVAAAGLLVACLLSAVQWYRAG